MSVKPSISLTDQQDAFARSLVETGCYSSLSSVLQQGLELLRQKTEAEAAETEGRAGSFSGVSTDRRSRLR